MERLERLKKAARPSEWLIFSRWGLPQIDHKSEFKKKILNVRFTHANREAVLLTLWKQFLKEGNVSTNSSVFVSIVD